MKWDLLFFLYIFVVVVVVDDEDMGTKKEGDSSSASWDQVQDNGVQELVCKERYLIKWSRLQDNVILCEGIFF